MNIIKYLPNQNKSKCIECNYPLIKDIKSHEIYCSHCGMVFLDFSPMTKELLNYALKYDYLVSTKRKRKLKGK